MYVHSVEDLLRPGKRLLCVDVPLGLPRRRQVVGKGVAIRQGVERRAAVQAPCVERLLEPLEKQPSEEAREDADGQEEAGAAGDPTGAVVGEAASGHYAMQMGMMHEGLSPRMPDRKESDLGAQMGRVRGARPERGGGGAEQEAIDDGLILRRDLSDRVGHREDDVEVLTVEEFRLALFDPRRAGQ